VRDAALSMRFNAVAGVRTGASDADIATFVGWAIVGVLVLEILEPGGARRGRSVPYVPRDDQGRSAGLWLK
jgi:hypothetical protein